METVYSLPSSSSSRLMVLSSLVGMLLLEFRR
jgi:hypothetical protein